MSTIQLHNFNIHLYSTNQNVYAGFYNIIQKNQHRMSALTITNNTPNTKTPFTTTPVTATLIASDDTTLWEGELTASTLAPFTTATITPEHLTITKQYCRIIIP
jgi:hypothetical protein